MLIAIEGIDGAGKTTIAHHIESIFNLTYIHYPHRDRMPQIKDFLTGKLDVPPKVRALLYFADQLWDEQKLRESAVVCDRYVLSTVAYQSTECGFETMKNLVELFSPPRPDLVIWIDRPVKAALKDISKRGKHEAFDKEHYLCHVRSMYEKMYEEKWFANHWERIDGSNPLPEIIKTVETTLNTYKNRL